MALQITDATINEVLQTDKLVVIDFWAEWCGPCKMVGPIIDQISEEYKDKVVVGKLDVDNNDETTSKYGIRNIPTILFIKNGEVVDKMVGAGAKNLFTEKIAAALIGGSSFRKCIPFLREGCFFLPNQCELSGFVSLFQSKGKGRIETQSQTLQ